MRKVCSPSRIREGVGRRGFSKVDAYDVLDFGEEELIAESAERIQCLYEELLRLGYLA